MFKKYSTIILIAFMAQSSFCLSVFAQAQNDRDSRLALNIKNTVARVGTEPNRKIKVKLRDGTKLKGYITEIKDDYFALLDDKSGKIVSVQYSQAAEAKRDGLPKFATALIGGGVLIGGLLILTAVGLRETY